MLLLQGKTALSDFRQARLLKQLQTVVSALQTIAADYCYLLDLAEPLTDQQLVQLQQLCQAELFDQTKQQQQTFWVIPRLGTLSPWSSKATEIMQHCGLLPVKRLERAIRYQFGITLGAAEQAAILPLLHDRMTQTVLTTLTATTLFAQTNASSYQTIPLLAQGRIALEQANQAWGLALSGDEINYLYAHYQAQQRDPTDVELMMFAQANSEHCRHKIFNASWIVDGNPRPRSLLQMIKHSFASAPANIYVAYNDNSAVIAGSPGQQLLVDPASREYQFVNENIPILMKVETHNHPTAISPFPGAATGAGGEIRDEAATGRGARTKAGLCGFSVSNLRIPGFEQRWETDYGRPGHMASALTIMLQGPIGAAAFNNEFGRPNIAGYFRTFEMKVPGVKDSELRGYHKPIMLAGGMGNIRPELIKKQPLSPEVNVIVLGGPAMLIGLGGGAASSISAGTQSAELDYASVQRDNPEMQRRCQQVIDACAAYGAASPILSIHDVGAGGLANAIPELLHDGGVGGILELRAIPNAEPGMSPLAIWCNEAQERYVLAVNTADLARFAAICQRERCPYAVLGKATAELRLKLNDAEFANTPVDMPLEVLLGKPPQMLREARHSNIELSEFETDYITVTEAIYRVLRLPAVASKAFLITIADRSVGGLVSRDQMVGPWQIPVADVGVTATDFTGYHGEAMAIGERTPLALINPVASGRMAIAEAITNILAADIQQLGAIKLSANWMAAAGDPAEEADLYDTVQAVAEWLCPRLGIAIPVGKDSMSMRTRWRQAGCEREMTAPLSLIISAFAPVRDIRRTLTPQLQLDQGHTDLILIDLSGGKLRLGGSALAQVYRQLGNETPDLEDVYQFKNFIKWFLQAKEKQQILAYHDRSDGGLLVSLLEMAFASRSGLTISLDQEHSEPLEFLFNEELGVVVQTRRSERDEILASLDAAGLRSLVHLIGWPNEHDQIVVQANSSDLLVVDRAELQTVWAETSYRMQALRDNPACAVSEWESHSDPNNQGLQAKLTFSIKAPEVLQNTAPRIAILREQGVNGQREMAAAFKLAGFTAIDVTMQDLQTGQQQLSDFIGLAACGGFSFGDVLGAGGGWAKAILFNSALRAQFAEFFQRQDTFALGVCNGCQMLAQLTELIPGAAHWPLFLRNTSEQFEARFSQVEIVASNSILFKDMAGSLLPVVVSHGEGRVAESTAAILRYVDSQGQPTQRYPDNPNGSANGATGFTNQDGRFTIMMPHPERVFRTVQCSWAPHTWGEASPWMQMFYNARAWVG